MADPGMNLDWGSWVLGDLPEVLSRVSDLVAPTSNVEQAEVRPPRVGEQRPIVRLVVADQQEARRMRDEVEAGEFYARFQPGMLDGSWLCDVAGVELEVRVGRQDR